MWQGVGSLCCRRLLSILAAEAIEGTWLGTKRFCALDFSSVGVQHDCVLAGDSKRPGEHIGRLSMRRKGIIVGSIVVLGLLVFFYFYGGSTVPDGQQPLVRLNNSNIAALKDAFNGSANSVRVLVLVSPT